MELLGLKKSALTEIKNPISAFKSRVGKIKIINNEEHLNQGSTEKYKHLKKIRFINCIESRNRTERFICTLTNK